MRAVLLAVFLVANACASAATVTIAAIDSTTAARAGATWVCDGDADDIEMAAAIASLPTTGGDVLIHAGTYDITASIGMRAKLWLHGEGANTILKLNKARWPYTTSGTYLLADGPGHLYTPQSNITISDLTIDMDGWTGPVYATPIVFWGYWAPAKDNRVERCVIKGALGYAILSLNNEGLHIRGNTITDMGDSCVEIRSTRGAIVSDNTFRNCSIQTYADHVYSIATSGIVYSGNDFTNVGIIVADPLTGEQIDGLSFVGNTWRLVGNYRSGFWINATKRLLISGNTFDTSLSTSATARPIIRLVAGTVSDALIYGNTFKIGTESAAGSISSTALTVEGAHRVTFADNLVTSLGTSVSTAVHVTGGATGAVIRDNAITGGGTGASSVGVLVGTATRTLVDGNTFDTLGLAVSVGSAASATRVTCPLWTNNVNAAVSDAGAATVYAPAASRGN